jgi:RecA-family ATPase
LLPRSTVSGLVADGGVGKTTIALHQAVCIVLGRPWLELPTIQGPVIFLSAEDDLEELHRRLELICVREGVLLSELRDLIIIPLAGRDALLATPDFQRGGMKPTELWRELRTTLASIKPITLVLDTLADVFGGNEIDRSHARSFVGMLRGLAIEFELSVLVLSHPSVSGMTNGRATSGSTGWANSMRSRLYLERPSVGKDDIADQDARVLSVKKANYGPTGLCIRLRWHAGAFVRDDGEIAAEREQESEAKASKVDDVFLKLLGTFTQQNRRVGSTPSSIYAPKVFKDLPEASGFSKKQLQDAMERLLRIGAIHVAERGPPSHRRSYLLPGAPPRPLQCSEPSNPLPTPK